MYAVDVKQVETAVFVARGRVAVTHRGSRSTITLEQGQGADVAPGKPLEVNTWSAERVSQLMTRFGRYSFAVVGEGDSQKTDMETGPLVANRSQ